VDDFGFVLLITVSEQICKNTRFRTEAILYLDTEQSGSFGHLTGSALFKAYILPYIMKLSQVMIL